MWSSTAKCVVGRLHSNLHLSSTKPSERFWKERGDASRQTPASALQPSPLLEAADLTSVVLSQGGPSWPDRGPLPESIATWSLQGSWCWRFASHNFANLSAAPTGLCRALSMELWDIIRSELFFCCSEIISGGKTPGWPRVVINFMCLGCNHHSEKKRLRAGMIDGGHKGDGPWNCSTSSVPLIAGRSSEITSLHLPRINKHCRLLTTWL